jgi:hypothetical protein
MRKSVLSLSILSFFLIQSCEQSDNLKEKDSLIFNIPELVNKTPEQVIKILGEPDSAYTQYVVTIPVYTQWYGEKGLEIQYLEPEKLSKDIVIHNAGPLLFEPSTLALFGLEPTTPTISNPRSNLRWSDLQGYKTIHFYNRQEDANGDIRFQIYFKTE